ncbi:hypothetical protein [Burkholderia sp. TSV86]|uniref:hypothetical protein n=1 Tax=Burkholderia sp. TSV86 TaxID=1385594 RepID=UPI00075D8C8E|nr:hypothetical protein [Burkholderia sp. TSV86]KVE35488.1 hypothetical protein WS68_05910 [Burkholderia sp. TSV86]
MLRVPATSDFGRKMLRHWLDAFIERHPNVSVSLLLIDNLSHFWATTSISRSALACHRTIQWLQSKWRTVAAHGEPAHPDVLADQDFIPVDFGWAIKQMALLARR